MRKFVRIHLEKFLTQHANDASALEIGVPYNMFTHLFPNTRTLDIDPARKPDYLGDVQQMPFENSEWKLIICLEVLEHVEDPQKAIDEMFRVLVPGGTLILTTRFAYPVHDAPNDYWRFTPYGLKRLFKNWNITDFQTEGGPFTAIAVLLQRIMFQNDLKGGKFTKGILYMIALVFFRMDGLVKKSYGDIAKTIQVHDVLSSGVYIVAQKPAILQS